MKTKFNLVLLITSICFLSVVVIFLVFGCFIGNRRRRKYNRTKKSGRNIYNRELSGVAFVEEENHESYELSMRNPDTRDVFINEHDSVHSAVNPPTGNGSSHICNQCNRGFGTDRGLQQHVRCSHAL